MKRGGLSAPFEVLPVETDQIAVLRKGRRVGGAAALVLAVHQTLVRARTAACSSALAALLWCMAYSFRSCCSRACLARSSITAVAAKSGQPARHPGRSGRCRPDRACGAAATLRAIVAESRVGDGAEQHVGGEGGLDRHSVGAGATCRRRWVPSPRWRGVGADLRARPEVRSAQVGHQPRWQALRRRARQAATQTPPTPPAPPSSRPIAPARPAAPTAPRSRCARGRPCRTSGSPAAELRAFLGGA